MEIVTIVCVWGCVGCVCVCVWVCVGVCVCTTAFCKTTQSFSGIKRVAMLFVVTRLRGEIADTAILPFSAINSQPSSTLYLVTSKHNYVQTSAMSVRTDSTRDDQQTP